jgi:hypothetical protein
MPAGHTWWSSLEYSIIASLMMMALCTQSGVTDVYIFADVFSNTWACMIFGLLANLLSKVEFDCGNSEQD